MDQKTTNDLTEALGRWVTQAAFELEPDALNALQQCIEVADADVRIVVNLREGAIELQGVAKSAGKSTGRMFRCDRRGRRRSPWLTRWSESLGPSWREVKSIGARQHKLCRLHRIGEVHRM